MPKVMVALPNIDGKGQGQGHGASEVAKIALFYRSISFAILACSSKLMVCSDSIGPGLHLVGARFVHFFLGKLTREFKLRRMSIFHEIQMATFR